VRPPASCPTPHLLSFPTRRSSDLLEGRGARPVLQRRLLEILDAVQPRRDPVAARGHLARDLRVAALVGIGERALEIVDARREPRSESTRLNSSHQIISYAVFCLKK